MWIGAEINVVLALQPVAVWRVCGCYTLQGLFFVRYIKIKRAIIWGESAFNTSTYDIILSDFQATSRK